MENGRKTGISARIAALALACAATAALGAGIVGVTRVDTSHSGEANHLHVYAYNYVPLTNEVSWEISLEGGGAFMAYASTGSSYPINKAARGGWPAGEYLSRGQAFTAEPYTCTDIFAYGGVPLDPTNEIALAGGRANAGIGYPHPTWFSDTAFSRAFGPGAVVGLYDYDADTYVAHTNTSGAGFRIPTGTAIGPADAVYLYTPDTNTESLAVPRPYYAP